MQNGDLPDKALVQIGVYIYTRNALQKLSQLERTPLERTEKLEQLRALENGINIGITVVDDYQSLSVDTEQDLARAREIFASWISARIPPILTLVPGLIQFLVFRN